MLKQPAWPFPSAVGALQTLRTNKHGQPLDMRPENQTSEDIQQLLAMFKLPHPPKMLKQVHGRNVIELSTEPDTHNYALADACWTRQPGVLCSIMTADCLPILVSNRQATLVAAIHCGWRSLAAGIITEVFEQLQCPADDLIIWLGPCISAAVYQVGPDLIEQFLSQTNVPELRDCFINDPHAQGKYLADLHGIAMKQWQRLGATDIHASEQCTIRDNDLYYSWRAEKTSARMASMIWLKP
ncbi:peptidoglycan editing factor PgeF [Marinicella sp. W31]|uniref:peptidoglycan editing factor PgeF n=1 Tax=Marinicella sp. W31 TaxID=3023713 RepID=UPI0037583BD8